MLQQMKEQIAKRKSSGFTLMELLIVIAIISVLVAIAIPTFAAQLDNAKDSADKANARALYALAQSDWMTSPNHEAENTYGSLEDHKVIVQFKDGSSQSFTFSDRTDSVTVSFDSNVGAMVRVDGKAHDGSGISYPEG